MSALTPTTPEATDQDGQRIAVNDTASSAAPSALQIEIETLRDQRDLYRTLLLAEPGALAAFMNHALETVERIRTALRTPTRDPGAFHAKIERLIGELSSLSEALLGLHLPTVSVRLTAAMAALHEVQAREAATGNDLLPAMVVLEELCSHLTVAADNAAVHVPLGAHEPAALELESSQRRSQLRMTAAIEQLASKCATEHAKRVGLVTMGLEDVPDEWAGTLYDLLGQLVRNAIEHGIETPAARAAGRKPAIGTLVIEFVDQGSRGCELNVQDDGGGLNAEAIAAAAVRRGLLAANAAKTPEPSRLVALIFQSGFSTAADGGEGPARGQGLGIVRDHVRRLGGKLQFSTKRGYYTRFHIRLPSRSAAAPAGAAD